METPMRKWILAAAIVATAIVAVVAMFMSSQEHPLACDSNYVIDGLKPHHSPIKIFDLYSIEQLPTDGEFTILNCIGTAVTSIGQIKIHYGVNDTNGATYLLSRFE